MNKSLEQLLPIIVFSVTVILGIISLASAVTMQRFPLEMFPAGPYDSGQPPGGGGGGDTCNDDSDCGGGLVCRGGSCSKDPDDCPSGSTGNNCPSDCHPSDGCDACNCPGGDNECGGNGGGPFTDPDCPCGDSDPSTDCGDDDDDDTTSSPSPSPSGSPSPSPSPSSTPSPSPQASMACTELSGVDTNATYDPGDGITFTCRGTGTNLTLDNAEFRISHDGGSFDPVPRTSQQLVGDTLTATANYTIPAGGYGTYTAQCRVCAGSVCTVWGQAQVAN